MKKSSPILHSAAALSGLFGWWLSASWCPAAAAPADPEPGLIRKASWQESLIASREALLAWESRQDAAALAPLGVQAGPWLLLGPLSSKSKEVQELRSAQTLDLARRYPGENGQEIQWEVCDSIRDGQVNDLTGVRGASKDAVFFACRTLTFERGLNRGQLSVSLSGDRGSAWCLPARQGLSVESLSLVREGNELAQRGKGESVLLLELRAGASGQRRFACVLKPNQSNPGAGDTGRRLGRRRQLVARARAEFADPGSQLEMKWEIDQSVWVPSGNRLEDWQPGWSGEFLRRKYREAIPDQVAAIEGILAEEKGTRATALAGIKEPLRAWVSARRSSPAPEPDAAGMRTIFHQLAAVREAIDLSGRLVSVRLAVEDQRGQFGGRYPQAGAALARIEGAGRSMAELWSQMLRGTGDCLTSLAESRKGLDTLQSEILLDTPLLGFETLLVVKGGAGFSSNWDGPNRLGSELIALSPVRPDGRQTTLHKGTVSDYDVHWDGKRILFSDTRGLWEMNADGTGLRRVTAENAPATHYDAVYLPDERIVCASNACEQAVPCTGGGNVGNLHLLDADGKNERRVTFDQDHDWNPVVMNDGRILYTRWEYADLPHYFSRLLFRMNPDGSGQTEYYGSGSYWPNAMYWPRPIPGHPTAFVCVVSGHHGTSRSGELLLLDPAKGRHEAEGVIQRIPGYGKKVEPIIRDNLVSDVWPKFAAPYPLAEPGTHLGAGKYFLVCVQQDALSSWDLCLVDVFDNVTPILKGGYMTPTPLRARPKPPVIASNLDPKQKDGVIYVAGVYQGPGLRGYPRGSIKALRIGTHHYRYPGNGDTYAASSEGGWDIKRILGTVPVHEDGSAMFRVPANTPIFVQPLDAEGKAQQLMRSWYTAMPGEFASCVGCHEPQNTGPAAAPKPGLAALCAPVEIAPWHGPVRGFSFDREVQPVLDRRCAGCHNGQPVDLNGKKIATADLRAKQLRPDYTDRYSPAYLELQKYVRRPGFESDMHMHAPGEFDADTSALVQLLKKGHHNVQLTSEEWERLYTWIDFNVPYPASWGESHRPPRPELVERRAKNKALFAGVTDCDETPLPLPPVGAYEPPQPVAAPSAAPGKAENWPFDAARAVLRQKEGGAPALELTLGQGVTMKFCQIPAGSFLQGDSRGFADEQPQSAVTISRPYYLGQFEVTHEQYACFDPAHKQGYIETRNKDRINRGIPLDQPGQPVVRVTWHEAMAFCEWLSRKTGCRCTLPSEAQWEWACRAGTATTHSFGDYAPGMNRVANIADTGMATWNYGRSEAGYSDGISYLAPVGRFQPNAWSLHDMHGNVAEWCLTTYRPYPYTADDGRDDPRNPGMKVVRGGSWNDTMRQATSASRWRYQPHQPVYNVGFRVLVDQPGAVAQR